MGAISFTRINIYVLNDLPFFVAVIVNEVALATTLDVPEIWPVLVLKVSPVVAARSGEQVYVAPVKFTPAEIAVGVIAEIAVPFV